LLAIFVMMIDDTRSLRGYFGSYEPISVPQSVRSLRALAAGVMGSGPATGEIPANFVRFYIGMPLILVAPATFLMGCSFPILQRVVQTDLTLVGRRVGALLVANIVGSVVGTVLTGWVLLNLLGTAATLEVLAAMSAVFAVLSLTLMQRTTRLTLFNGRVRTVVAALLGVGLCAAVIVLMPSSRAFWARLHGTSANRILFREDGSGLAVIRLKQSGFIAKDVVYVNGLGQSTLPYGDIHTALGALPAFLHPAPVNAAVIGLGSGDTVHAVAGRPGIQRITCIEIVRPQLDTLEQLGRYSSYGGLRSLLANPRIEHIFGDGRIHLMRGGRAYDVIEADALRPGSAYAGNLYSEEYFRLVRERLTPNGLAATWAPTPRVQNSFIRVFPYVLSVPGVLIGSNAPIEVDRAAIATRVADPQVQRYYELAGIDIERLMNGYLSAPRVYTPAFDRGSLSDFNTDLFPKDEFDLGLSR
jgi:spermidine synthase